MNARRRKRHGQRSAIMPRKGSTLWITATRDVARPSAASLPPLPTIDVMIGGSRMLLMTTFAMASGMQYSEITQIHHTGTV